MCQRIEKAVRDNVRLPEVKGVSGASPIGTDVTPDKLVAAMDFLSAPDGGG